MDDNLGLDVMAAVSVGGIMLLPHVSLSPYKASLSNSHSEAPDFVPIYVLTI